VTRVRGNENDSFTDIMQAFDGKQIQISTQTEKSTNKSCMPFGKTGNPKKITCIVPKDSKIVKQGELMKVGQKTLIM
jgi:hypothetical protein